ncbi:MAG: COX15/CtaA family protein [Candidatus Omnitrophica bacterium]|nr:COX15/CtaA family protein [Candidatus Omnitrophota bacterium]
MAVHRYAIATAIATFFLLIAGSLVTSTDSGLAVPDWPLSYGVFFPPMVGGIFYEHGHRMIAGLVGLMILGLAVWLWRREDRRWVKRLAAAALAAVVLQVLLGGLTVLLLLPPQISIAHACLGQAVFCLVVCIAQATSPGWVEPPARRDHPAGRTLGRFGVAAAVIAAIQLLLGAIIRHTGFGVWWHITGAVLLIGTVTAVSLTTKRFVGRQALWRGHVLRLHALVGIQLLVGIGVFFSRGSVPLRTVHVALGALVLAQAVVLAWSMLRCASTITSSSPNRA